MIHELGVKRVHAPGGDGHVHERHREHAHGEQNRDDGD